MYGGLFGDLPAAKNDSFSSKEKKNRNDGDGKETEGQQDKKKKINAIASDIDGSSKKKGGAEAVGKPVKNSSVLQSLGVAGTSMAFVPSHLKRKRNATSNKATSPPVFAKPSAPQNYSTINDTVEVPAVAMDLATWQEETQLKSIGQHDTLVHEPHASATQTQKSSFSGNISFSDFPLSSNSPNTVAAEPEALRRLHDSVTEDTEYDPFVPNDLLQYWERQAAVQERKELEREAKEAMEAQARMRKQLEVERQELERSGDVNKLAEHHENRARMIASGGGRGRGRGVSNLPKWLVDKQKEEAKLRNMPEGKD